MSEPPPALSQSPVLRSAPGTDRSQSHGEVDTVLWPETSRLPARRLGAHRDLDRRRHQFAVEVTAGWLLPPATIEWPRFAPIFEQGDCAGASAFAIVGALSSAPLLTEEMRQVVVPLPTGGTTTLFDIRVGQYTTDLALSIYAQATHLDQIGDAADVWPKADPGTTGDAVCQVVRNMGLITGWGHCLGVTSLPHALQMYGPLMVGLGWYEGFDDPGPIGAELRPTGRIRGGNMLLCRRYEHGGSPDTSWYWLDGNWGGSYGIEGQVRISAASLAQLYADGQAHAIALKTGNPRA